jgi:hypothetical protein
MIRRVSGVLAAAVLTAAFAGLAAKADGRVASGTKWPKFWSQCNARLKGNSA